MPRRLRHRVLSPRSGCLGSSRAQRAALGLFLHETDVENKNSKCGEDVQFAAVGVGVWTRPHTCYQYGLYTRLHPLAPPGPALASQSDALGEQRCRRGAARWARGRAEAGVGAEGRSAAGRGLPAADSPRASVCPPHPSPFSVTISSDRFWEGPLASSLTAERSRALLRRSLAFSGTELGDEVTLNVDDVIHSAAASTYGLHNWTAHNSPGGLSAILQHWRCFPRETRPGMGTCGRNPPRDRLSLPDSLREGFALCSPPTVGSPGRGERRARPLGVHVEVPPLVAEETSGSHGTPQGCQPSPSGRMDPLQDSGEPGRGWGQEWSGGASPHWPGGETRI